MVKTSTMIPYTFFRPYPYETGYYVCENMDDLKKNIFDIIIGYMNDYCRIYGLMTIKSFSDFCNQWAFIEYECKPDNKYIFEINYFEYDGEHGDGKWKTINLEDYADEIYAEYVKGCITINSPI